VSSYRIVHSTTYSYDAEVTGSFGQFYLRPRDLGWQRCVAHEVQVSPEPADLFRHVDVYGNTKSYFHVVRPHTKLTIDAISMVEVFPPQLDDQALAQPWERARPRVRADEPDAWEAIDFTFASPYVDIPDAAASYAAESFPAGRPIGEAASELMHRIHADFTYKFGTTTLRTTVSELLSMRTGVCQDYAHVMVSGLRSLGLAARYVSGYLATRPPSGRPRQVGADASHAWVGCWVPGTGWLHLDPTNDRLCDEAHATVAWGRDYGDVAPVRGVIFTEAKKSKMKVSVDMAPA
jgi:transglutaminase-like putative cysteine protease